MVRLNAKRIITMLVAGFLFGIGIGAGAFYFQKPAAREIIDRAKQNVWDLDSVGYDIEIRPDVEVENTENFIGEDMGGLDRVVISGNSKTIESEEGHDSESRMTVDLHTADQTSPIFTLETRFIDDVTYFALTDVHMSPFSISAMFLSAFEGKWVKYDPKGSVVGELNKRLAKELDGSVVYGEDMTKNELIVMKNIFMKNRLLNVGEKYEQAVLDGEKTYLLDFSVNKNGLKSASRELDRELGESEGFVSEFVDGVNEAQDISGQIWVGRSDYYPRRVLFDMNMDNSKIGLEDGEAYQPLSLNGETAFDIRFRDFNKSVEIDAPKNARFPEEMVVEMFGADNGGVGKHEQPVEYFEGVQLPPIQKINFSGPTIFKSGAKRLSFDIPDGDLQITEQYFHDELAKNGWGDIRVERRGGSDPVWLQGEKGEFALRVELMGIFKDVSVTLELIPVKNIAGRSGA